MDRWLRSQATANSLPTPFLLSKDTNNAFNKMIHTRLANIITPIQLSSHPSKLHYRADHLHVLANIPTESLPVASLLPHFRLTGQHPSNRVEPPHLER